jgi:dipeptide/tripeptide permease
MQKDEPKTVPLSVVDVPQLGLVAAVASLSTVFWIVGGMEMIERLAFYGVKAIAALYATASRQSGGLGVSPGTLGDLFMLWALVQSVLPVFVGGLSDRFGYKRTIFLSTIVKIIGYLTMAAWPSYVGFFAGAMLLATGTAIIKPGIQGTLVRLLGGFFTNW